MPEIVKDKSKTNGSYYYRLVCLIKAMGSLEEKVK